MRTPPTAHHTLTPNIRGAQLAIVASHFNADITQRLCDGALETLHAAGIVAEQVRVVRVPGAFEIPVVAQQLAASGRYEGVLCLGCVIKGDTDHFDHICRTAADGLQRAALATGRPIIFGILTCDTRAQAEDRAGGRHGNLGSDGAKTLLEMCAVMRELK